jgi:ATP-dependent helicase HrpB
MEVLRRLGAVDGRGLTPVGRALQQWPLPPRIGRFLLEAGGGERAARVAAILAERRTTTGPPEPVTTDSDVLSLEGQWREMPASVQSAARELMRVSLSLARSRRAAEEGREGTGKSILDAGPLTASEDERLRRALFLAFPDRLARRRSPHSSRLLLANGRGAQLARESGVRDAEYLVALEVTDLALPGNEALVRLASAVDRNWISATNRETVHRYDEQARAVRALLVERHGAIVLAEKPVSPDPELAAKLLVEALGKDTALDRLRVRLRFAGLEADLEAALARACLGLVRIPGARPEALLDHATLSRLEKLAPGSLRLPSGRLAVLEYREDGSVHASVKLQELFGLAETPLLGPSRIPVTLSLLAPSGRPVQVTQDLASFWNRTYSDVRKELRARYPRHPWPEDPWTAEPTHRAKRRPR